MPYDTQNGGESQVKKGSVDFRLARISDPVIKLNYHLTSTVPILCQKRGEERTYLPSRFRAGVSYFHTFRNQQIERHILLSLSACPVYCNKRKRYSNKQMLGLSEGIESRGTNVVHTHRMFCMVKFCIENGLLGIHTGGGSKKSLIRILNGNLFPRK